MTSTEELEVRIDCLITAVAEVIGAVIATRSAVVVIARQPNLLLSTEAKAEIEQRVNISVDRLEAAFEAMNNVVRRGSR